MATTPLPRFAHGFQILIALLFAVGLLAIVSACDSGGDGDGGGGTASAAPETGSVGILLTDGPVAPGTFKHIWVTYTEIILIGEPGQVTIFEGRETVDLRDLEDISKLATVGRNVRVGKFEKIRLLIEEIELVRADTGDSILLSEPPNKLPPKIDLNPQESFYVRAGKLLLLQIDMDAGKSIHIVQTGQQLKYQFRPVVFVDIITRSLRGKLVLLRGFIENIDDEDGTFDLCRTHSVSRPGSDGRITRDSDHEDPGDDGYKDHCVEVVALFEGNKTSFFDDAGDPTGFDALDEGEEASVLGRFVPEEDDEASIDENRDHEDLVFEAEVVQLGDPLALDGVADTVVENDRFLMLLDEGQSIVSDDTLLIQLFDPETKVFTRKGVRLSPSKIMVGDPVRATGIPAISNTVDDRLKAAFIMVDLEAVEIDRIEGVIIEDPEDDGARLTVFVEGVGPVCVDVPEEARVFEVTLEDGQGGAEAIDRSDLKRGDRLNIFGSAGDTIDDCFTAETVISFGDDPEAVPVPSLNAGSPGLAGAAYGLDLEEGEADGEVAFGAPSAVEVYEIELRRVKAGFIWAKLPGDEDGASQEAASQ